MSVLRLRGERVACSWLSYQLRGHSMEWTGLVPVIVVLGGIGTVWWRLNSRIDRLETKFDTKFDTLTKFLTDNLLALNREIGELKGGIGELKGQARTHPPSQ